MIQVYVTFPVHGRNEQAAKQGIHDLLKNHFPEIKWKIDGSIIVTRKKPRLVGQAQE